jgi:hypothetical protein
MNPTVLFGVQFTLSLVAYALLGLWYVEPSLSTLPRETALQPLVWVHAFRMIGGRSWLRALSARLYRSCFNGWWDSGT